MTPARHRHLATLRVCSDMAAQPNHGVLYFVICSFKDGRASVERDVTRMTRDATLHDIRTGELSDVVMVIETEMSAGNSRDVTADILAEAAQLRAQDREPIMSRLDALIASFDHNRDHAKNWEPANG